MADFEVISEVTLDTDTVQWEIDEIPQDYTHLELDLHLRGDTTTNQTYEVGMFFNTYTGANKYGYGVAYSNNSNNGTASDVGPNGTSYINKAARQTGNFTAANTYAINKMFIANYSSTAITHKQIVFQQSANTGKGANPGTWWMGFGAGAGTNVGAITKITLWPISSVSGQKLVAGCCYTLSGWK
jgi:hypothetical protein